ncbi:hypothetical protein CLAFUW4_12835 [Fulvia fulva]|uniref:Uncharacterized protein n=1 Tax=Passalora fulva TaxID=5499 RepID=A0A9Q8PK24_PASFU|nr:uncharacterized protein CLAFUR5_12701 [Fulvia fulva]KAK4612338.1 hypothetical protein CLAFUR4_12839 [Fulvia fulva]KAK4612559.1 hypothetical protein CLAFUR0_12845 [Fulvia fulva]UJO23913.1 hypothetical protein CLAFUR5_12701 [Fulvia fulva]WPV21679.1 hypothetical protein CLAFUW4_12835 [Fulvia fulva]WPV36061.1 hypothetical protein CLAFUW7_12843 [Fulvia fulva]
MTTNLISRLPLELRLQIYEDCDCYPDSTCGRSYKDPWSDLPRSHDIGKRLDGVAMANLLSAFPELVSDMPEFLSELHGVKTLAFSNRYNPQTATTLPSLNSLCQILQIAPIKAELHIALDTRHWNHCLLSTLIGSLVQTRQTVHVSLICNSVPAKKIVAVAELLASRGGSVSIYEECACNCHRFAGIGPCTWINPVPRGLRMRPPFWFMLHETQHGGVA